MSYVPQILDTVKRKYENDFSWEKLNELGKRYIELSRKNGNPERIPVKRRLMERSQEQIDIANEIIERSSALLHGVCLKILYGGTVVYLGRVPFVVQSRGNRIKVDEEELFNVGVIGVISSLHNYRSDDCDISTFVANNACVAINRYLDQDHTVRTPIGKMEKSKGELRKSKGEKEPIEIIKEKFDFGWEQAAIIYNNIGDFRNYNLRHSLPHNDEPNEEKYGSRKQSDLGEEKEVEMTLDSALEESLTVREEAVIRLYYEIGDNGPFTLQEIGDGIDLTKERVRQIKEDAKEKLRRYFRRKKVNLDEFF